MVDFMLFWGFAFRQTNEQTKERTDICTFRVAFTTENQKYVTCRYEHSPSSDSSLQSNLELHLFESGMQSPEIIFGKLIYY